VQPSEEIAHCPEPSATLPAPATEVLATAAALGAPPAAALAAALAPRPAASRRWARIGSAAEVLGVVLLAGLVAAIFVWLAPDRGYRFRTSSSLPTHQAKGWTGITAADGLFFHTKKQEGPWVEIAFDRRKIHRVKVWNRETNRERAIPLVLEVADGKGPYREVGRKTETFSETTYSFKSIRASKIRLRVPDRKTSLHLHRVTID